MTDTITVDINTGTIDPAIIDDFADYTVLGGDTNAILKNFFTMIRESSSATQVLSQCYFKPEAITFSEPDCMYYDWGAEEIWYSPTCFYHFNAATTLTNTVSLVGNLQDSVGTTHSQ